LLQEWIEPRRLATSRGAYYFDIRVYVVAGEVVAGFARRAAAPCDGPLSSSPLAWLTTTGPRLPLRRRGGPSAIDCVELSEAEISDLFSLCRRVVACLENTAARANYVEEAASLPSFEALTGIEGKMQTVHVQPYKEPCCDADLWGSS
jgi:hypothetical protein